jgi:RimJ/RimL family protein N-acetyltransferase
MAWDFPATLPGPDLELRRLVPDDAAALAPLAGEDLFQYLSKRPPAWTAQGMAALLAELLPMPASAFYAIRSPPHSVVGMTAFLDISEYHRRLEIGWTWLAAHTHSSGLNRRVKFAMLEHAFGLGAERVCLTTDSRNTRSQRAIEKLGAVKEGVMRRYGRMPDGHQRDIFVYSIVRSEWQALRADFLAGPQPDR